MSWIDGAGACSLYCFAAVIGALLLGTLLRPVADPQRSGGVAFGRLDRFLIVYVGNVVLDELPGGSTGQRRDLVTRALVEQISRAMEERRVAATTRERFLEDLRAAIRVEEDLSANGAPQERDRRFLESRRWGLAERLHALLEDAPPEIVARIKAGFHALPGSVDPGADVDP